MSAQAPDAPARRRLPAQVRILTLAAFAIGTAEFVIAGILTQVAESLAITEGEAGHLITAYALAIVVGGPILTLWLSRYDKRRVLIGLMALFVVANLVTAFASGYTANISAFNVANALGGFIGGVVVDSSFGAAAIPFAAIVVPVFGLAFIVRQERGRHRPADHPSTTRGKRA